MITTEYCRVMGTYNQWMNARLYELCATIDDYDRRLDRGAFFRSIHSTLNHIMYADLAYMSRFTGHPEKVPELGVDLCDDFDDLWRGRVALDERILEFATSRTPEWFKAKTTYTSKVDGKRRTVPNWVLLTHMFNHQTHHRGQITTLLTQMGLDIGTTDIPFMPEFSPEGGGGGKKAG